MIQYLTDYTHLHTTAKYNKTFESIKIPVYNKSFVFNVFLLKSNYIEFDSIAWFAPFIIITSNSIINKAVYNT